MTSAAVLDLDDPPTDRIPASERRFTVRPAPAREPAYDDELVVGPPTGRTDRELPFDRFDAHAGGLIEAPRLATVTALRTGLPDPAQWARRLLVGVIESAAGRRPLNQLTALLAPAVAHGLRMDFERAAIASRPHWTHRATVRSVHCSAPTDYAAEVAATVRAGTRVRAVAMRLEFRHGRWCCTRLIFG